MRDKPRPSHLAIYKSFSKRVWEDSNPAASEACRGTFSLLAELGPGIQGLSGGAHSGIRIDKHAGRPVSFNLHGVTNSQSSSHEKLEARVLAQAMLSSLRPLELAVPGIELASMAVGGGFSWIHARLNLPFGEPAEASLHSDGRTAGVLSAISRLPFESGPERPATLAVYLSKNSAWNHSNPPARTLPGAALAVLSRFLASDARESHVLDMRMCVLGKARPGRIDSAMEKMLERIGADPI